MPRPDFKKEPALEHLLRIWKENRGNWLVATGILVSLLAWAVGYFDLIPEITASKRPNMPSLVLSGKTLMVHVVGCSSNEGQVIAMLYNGDSFNENSVPLRIETLNIHEQNALWLVHNLSYGHYAVYAFHDVDANDMVDPARERQGLSVGTAAQSDEARSDNAPVDYSEAAFEFTLGKHEVTVNLH
jgi:uncharacterized protein (DUF2141 family)